LAWFSLDTPRWHQQKVIKYRRITVSDHVYKTLEITGSSKTSIEDAVTTAISRAQESVHNLRWFEVTNVRGHLENGKIGHWQATIKLGITLDSPA
tara:strand:+ start:811 stop:1095 length:285 start_codon:yes stop_codon:yes gene_type:complete